jgi:hypothetical protein
VPDFSPRPRSIPNFVSEWTAFVAVLWSWQRRRFNDSSLGNTARYALLTLTLVAGSGCAELARPGETAAPPPEQPLYGTLAAKYLASVMRDRPAFGGF